MLYAAISACFDDVPPGYQVPRGKGMAMTSIQFRLSGYGYGTVPGGRWTIDTEGGHVVVSVSLIRSGYEYGTVHDRCGTIHTEAAVNVVNSVSRMRMI